MLALYTQYFPVLCEKKYHRHILMRRREIRWRYFVLSLDYRTSEPIALNKWHIAVASRTARDGTLQVDKRKVIEGMAEGAFTQLTFAGDLFIGGVEDQAHISHKADIGTSFVGDIQKVWNR